MLTKVFNNTHPITILLLFLFLVLVSASSFYGYFNIESFHNEFLVQNHYPNLGDVIPVVLSLFFVVSLGVLVNYIVHENSITGDNSFALLFFVLLISSFPGIVIFNPILASTFFVVLALKNLLSLHVHKKMTIKLFNAGFLIGIAAVIYPYSILYGILIYLGIIIYGADNWRQWFLPIVGILIPFYLLFTGYFWFDNLGEYWDRFFIHSFRYRENDFYGSKNVMIVLGIYLLITIFAIFDYSSNMRLHKLDTRKSYAMTYLGLFIGVIIAMFGTITNGQELIILFLPISAIWAKFIQHKKKPIWRNVFMGLIIIIIIVSYITSFNIT
ncbi:MAG: DUF6427 family protein [Bacteroidota bacterium]